MRHTPCKTARQKVERGNIERERVCVCFSEIAMGDPSYRQTLFMQAIAKLVIGTNKKGTQGFNRELMVQRAKTCKRQDY